MQTPEQSRDAAEREARWRRKVQEFGPGLEAMALVCAGWPDAWQNLADRAFAGEGNWNEHEVRTILDCMRDALKAAEQLMAEIARAR